MKPRELDAAINGLEVFINERHDGTVYATTHDFSRFNVEPVKRLRIPLDEITPEWDVETDPRVVQAIAELQQ